METIVAWIIYLSLQFLVLCNCYPVTPLASGPSSGADLDFLFPFLLCVAVLVTVVLLFVGCTWCRRIFKKDACVSQSIQLGETGSSEVVDPGILNPLNDIRFPITTPISHHSTSYRGLNQHINVQEVNESVHLPYYPGAADNNNLFEDNNNGPISPQELENIVNNNAENYIVSEYENRNLNHEAQVEVLEEVQIASTPSSNQASPSRSVWSEYRDWLDDPNGDFPRTQLRYLQVIGKGWFGRIVEAEAHSPNGWTGYSSEDNVIKAAVKILDENISVMEKCNFLSESRLLKNANHENILRFLGKSLAQDPWFILLEYCPLGDLKHCMLSNKSHMQSLNERGIPLKIILDMSSALQYLHERNMLYDLACHNCLVNEGFSVRLGDYGDTEQRYPEHFHPLKGSDPLPLRWLAPEYAIIPQANHSSNIWSFGVFMWECCSWGALPYDNLLNEEIIHNVLRLNGIRLQEPVPKTQYTSYLFNVMQTCWNDDPTQRCQISQIFEYLQSLYANFYNPAVDDPLVQNFNARWETFKPNNIPKVDNSLPQGSPQLETNIYNLDFAQCDIVIEPDVRVIHPCGDVTYQNCAILSEAISTDDITLKVKSDSLNNLHGSFESISNNMNSSRESFSIANKRCSVGVEEHSGVNTTDASIDKSLLQSAVPEVAPWLMDVPLKTPEDISYIKNVSDIISDFDNMLSSEKTSSSESSPSRDVVTHTSGITCDHGSSQLILSEDGDEVSLNNSTTEINSCNKECQSQESAYETNIGSESVNNYLNTVPEISNKNIRDVYPTLDFRLTNSKEENIAVHPIFTTQGVQSFQELDSLQDSSYVPNANKDKDNAAYKRSSSGSETEDEVWRKRVELGLITEKIKMKSKSVTDFMVLTHIDMDLTDLESEETSYNSLETKGNAFYDVIQRKLKRNSLQQEQAVAFIREDFSSIPRNFSLNHFVSTMPELDLYKLWKSCKQVTLKNLRSSKSLSDLSGLPAKVVPFEDLLYFKKKMDIFLEPVCNKDYKNDVLNEARHFNLSDPCHLPVAQSANSVFPQHILVNNYFIDTLNGAAVEEDLKFSSNFNDINLNLYSNNDYKTSESSESQNKNDQWESTQYLNLPDELNSKEPLENEFLQDMFDNKEIMAVPNTSFDVDDINSADTSTPNSNQVKSLEESMVIPQISTCDTNQVPNIDEVSNNALVEQQIDRIVRNEILNITTKMAIAENENNLNIEFSSSPNNLENVEDEYGEAYAHNEDEIREASNPNIHIQNNDFNVEGLSTRLSNNIVQLFGNANPTVDCDKVEAINEKVRVKENIITNDLIQDLDSELEKLDAECEIAEATYFSPEASESLYENVEPNYRETTSTSGWYLHPKTQELEDVVPQLNAFPINLPSSNSSSVESLTENTNSDNYAVDAESVEALRNELQLKLPLAQRMTQIHLDSSTNKSASRNDDWINAEPSIPMCKPSISEANLFKHHASESSTNIGISSDISIPGQVQGKNEIMIHYSVYGIVPLSPIQEESWSEFSEMEKAADIDKTDASNSLSLGEGTSNIEQILPFDGVCDMKIVDPPCKSDRSIEMFHNDDTSSDCSDRTFILNDGAPTNLKRQHSLSADSLNSIEQFDIDDEKVLADGNEDTHQLVAHQVNELSSPFLEEPSHPMSTEEISQNVDNLLENISKTLENASKIGTISSECQNHADGESNSGSEASDKDNSKTYVIENKRDTVEDLNAVYNDQVADIPDDVSNVSKVSQPSFVSDIISPDAFDFKVSDKSASIHSHTKTLSMDSWCSNDTLFNVEETFDDAFLGDMLSPMKKADLFVETPPRCGASLPEFNLIEQPQIEMVMGCAENINQSIHDEIAVLSAIQSDLKSPPEKLGPLPPLPFLLPDPVIDSCNKLPVINNEDVIQQHDSIQSLDCSIKLSPSLSAASNSPNIIIDTSSADSDGMVTVAKEELSSEQFIAEKNLDFNKHAIQPLELCDSTGCNNQDTDSNENIDFCNIEMTSTPASSSHVLNTSTKNSVDCVIDDHFKFLESLNVTDKDTSSIVKCTGGFLQNEQNFAHSWINLSTSGTLGSSNSVLKSPDNNQVKLVNTSDAAINNILEDSMKRDKNYVNSSGISELSTPDISDIVKVSNPTQECAQQMDILSPILKMKGLPEFENINIQQAEALSSTGVNLQSSPDVSAVINDNTPTDMVNSASILSAPAKESSLADDLSYNPNGNLLDLSCPLLAEYMEATGLNMGLQNEVESMINNEDSPSFEDFKQSAGAIPQDLASNLEDNYNFTTIQELYSPGIRNIQFSGPLNEEVLSTSFNESSPLNEEAIGQPVNNLFQQHKDIGHMAPERLKDWESESDDSNCSSTSSAEFVWKEGDGSQFLNVPSVSYTLSGTMKHEAFRGASQSFADIPEEMDDTQNVHENEKPDDDDDEEEEEEVDFVPSSWDCHAAPSKSALKSPDTSQIETRKRVMFKKQKYQSIYEYPRDDEIFQTLPDFSTYAEWNAKHSNDYMPIEYQHYLSEVPKLSGAGFEDDFYISTSTSFPHQSFEAYSTLNSSQFFPGQQFSLTTNQQAYEEYLDQNEDQDFESLPPIPTEQELQQALGADIDILNSENLLKKSSDYVTPDSGTEDTSPGDLLEFEDILNKKNTSESVEQSVPADEGVDNDIDSNLPIKIIDDQTILPFSNAPSSATPLGGLRHTRDKLKLDLPPSPVARNSPCLISSGKNSSKDVRIFDFKNIDDVKSCDTEIFSTSNNSVNILEDCKDSDEQRDVEKCLSSLESDTCDSDVVSPNSVVSVIRKFSVNSEECTKPETPIVANSPPADGEMGVLQKSVVRIQDKMRRVSLEAVKGEGTLLDSGDEDSGIGSSAYATLERKCDHVPPLLKSASVNKQA